MQVIKPMMPIILDFTGRPLQPIGDGLAAFWAFVECPVVFVALFEEAGE